CADCPRHARRIEAADARHDGPLSGVWLHGRGSLARAAALSRRCRLMEGPDVLIVGARPAGLAAARALAIRSIERVMVVEREAEAGGIPLFCSHATFGLTDFFRPMTGRRYAEMLRRLVPKSQILTSTTVTAIGDDLQVTLSSSTGRLTVSPK